MRALREYLEAIAPGRILDVKNLEKSLTDSWEQFSGDDGGMMAKKLRGRMEDVRWDPPFLTFRIERHAGATRGSTKAEVQKWSLDIAQSVARCATLGHRQLRPPQPSLDIRPLAEEIAHLVAEGLSDPRLKLCPDGSVQVLIGRVLPSNGFKKTVEGRRRRFRKELCQRLISLGWNEAPGRAPYTFRRI